MRQKAHQQEISRVARQHSDQGMDEISAKNGGLFSVSGHSFHDPS